MSYRKARYADIEKWRNTVKNYNRRYYQKTADAPNSGKSWSQEEDGIIMKHTIPDREISVLIGRSMNAICKRRWFLKKKAYENGNVNKKR